ncbi:M23 family metallopeptidase [Demequina sp.]|uniref:M23 family metallopeptidase n=1 Tax=Demequina sp. TaxID=2050685 RepID=UPI003D0D90A7
MKVLAVIAGGVVLAVGGILAVMGATLNTPSVVCEIQQATQAPIIAPELDTYTDAQWDLAQALVDAAPDSDWRLMAVGVAASLYGTDLAAETSTGQIDPFTGEARTSTLKVAIANFYSKLVDSDSWTQMTPAALIGNALGDPKADVDESYSQAAVIVGKLANANVDYLLRQAVIDPTCEYDSVSLEVGETVTVGNVIWPVPGHYDITSRFGMRTNPVTGIYTLHAGVDIGAPCGSPIVAVRDGIVTAKDENAPGYGTYIQITNPDGFKERYAHMYPGTLYVEVGDQVHAGDVITRVGSTGRSTGCHLHIEIYNPQGQVLDAGKVFAWY